MRKLLLALFAGGLLSIATALPAWADPPELVGPHRHFLSTPGGEHLVGPTRCGNPVTAIGFSQFHHNVHTGQPNLEAFQNPNNPVSFRAAGC